MASMEITKCPEAAASWVVDVQGWSLEHYKIYVSELQSCPDGYLSVDVVRDNEDDSEMIRFSRVLEIELKTGKIDTILAARDPEKLRKCIEIEKSKVRTEMLQYDLENKSKDEVQGQNDDDSAAIQEILFERDPQKRIGEIENELQKLREFKLESDPELQELLKKLDASEPTKFALESVDAPNPTDQDDIDDDENEVDDSHAVKDGDGSVVEGHELDP